MGKDSSQFGTLTRLLIVLYAAGIVILGAYPIRRDLREVSGSIFGAVPAWFRKHSPIIIETKKPGELRVESEPQELSEKRDSGRGVAKLAPKGADSGDRITEADRKELDNLINSF